MAGLRVRCRLLVVVFGAMLVVGCGDEPAAERVESPSPTEATDEEGYELDVIAEAEPDEGEPPLTVRFLGYVEEEEGGPWHFHWDFGDGGTSTEQNPVHTYDRVGDFTAVFTVTDQNGDTGTDEIDIFVETED